MKTVIKLNFTKKTVSNNYLLFSMILADGPSSTGWSVEKLDPNTAQNHPAEIKIEKLRVYPEIGVQKINHIISQKCLHRLT